MRARNRQGDQPAVELAEFREHLLRSVLSAGPAGPLAERSEQVPLPLRRAAHRGWSAARRPLVGLLAASVLVVFALLVGSLTGGQQSAVAAELLSAAGRLDAVPAPALPAGSYWYIRTRERVLGIMSFRINGEDRTAAALHDAVDETWLANDGSGAQYGVQGGSFALTPAARRALVELERTQPQDTRPSGILFRGPKLISVSLGSMTLNPANLAALPTDTSLLRDLIASATNSSDPRVTARDKTVAEFQAIANALFYEPFNPRSSAALYRVLATLPDVHGPTPARDALGRAGMAVAIDSGNRRWGLVIDPSTGKLLERTETKIASDADDQQVPIGTVTWRQTITATSVVPEVATRADGTRLDTSRWTICGADPQAGNPDQGHCVDP